MITNQQHSDQMQHQQEHDDEREERRMRYKDQREEHRLQMQMHQDAMRQQSQLMTTMMFAIMGNLRPSSLVPPNLPPFQVHDDYNMQRDVGAGDVGIGTREHRREGKAEESDGE
jgi:hypothetical protein